MGVQRSSVNLDIDKVCENMEHCCLHMSFKIYSLNTYQYMPSLLFGKLVNTLKNSL